MTNKERKETPEKKSEETSEERPNREKFPTEEEEVVVDPNKIPRTKR